MSVDAKCVVEAILFSSPEPISIKRIARIVRLKVKEVERLIEELISDYNSRNTSLEIIRLKENVLMRVKPQYQSYVTQFVEKDLDKPTLRTLAVIAVNQPIELSKLVKIRGSRCYDHVKKLEEMGLIKSEKSGRTKVLTTTEEFISYFGLKAKDSEEVKRILKRDLSGFVG
jgi:segregation and condensation protein B